MSWLSALRKIVTAPVRAGLAPITATANIARHPRSIRAHLRAGIAAGLAPVRVATSTTKASLRLSPHALIAHRLRAGAARLDSKPITRGGNSWRGGATGGGGAYGGGYSATEDDDDDDQTDGPDDDGGDDDDNGIGDVDYAAFIGGRQRQLGGFFDDAKSLGLNLAKGAASGILSSASRSLSPAVAAPPPRPAGMSTTAKLAIGAAVAVPVLFVLSRRRAALPATA